MSPEQSSPADLVALLNSDASLELKGRACQQLAIAGGLDAVPALAALLSDEKLSPFTRTALEIIPSPAAGAALRRALPKLTGSTLAGAIDSLGVIHEAAAVPALIALVDARAPEIAAEALAALGKIATPEACATLIKTLASGRAELLTPAAHASLVAARRLIQDSRRDAALPLLGAIDTADLPTPLTAAAKRLRAQPPVPSPRRALFDGKSFSGWEGDPTWFRIEDGAVIAGRMDQRIPQNEFLATERDFGDFELRLQLRLVAEKGNAGVQFRSQRVPDSREMIGYQADVAPIYWGSLYDESRRRTFLAEHPDADTLKAILRPDGWNDYRIRCEGPRVRLWLNDQLTVDYTELDTNVPRSGKIGLQIHAGAPSEAWYRRVEIEDLIVAR